MYNLVHDSTRVFALTLLGSSYVVLTYQVRPFTNSIEAILVALSLVLLKKMLVSEANKTSAQVRTLTARLYRVLTR